MYFIDTSYSELQKNINYLNQDQMYFFIGSFE
jgi:hypothetical protein